MQAFRSLSLSHFRSHLQQEVHIDSRPVVIFGCNGSGKTSILEAVSMFSPGRGLRGARLEEMIRRPERLGWKLHGLIGLKDRSFDIEIVVRTGSSRKITFDGKSASPLDLAQIAPIIWLTPAMDRIWTESSEGRRRLLDRLTFSFNSRHAQTTLRYQKALRERNHLLKDHVADDDWYDALERQMAEAGVRVHAERRATIERLNSAQSKYETAFPTTKLELVQKDGDIPESANDLREIFRRTRVRDRTVGRTLFGPQRTDLNAVFASKNVAARDCSTGEQKALLISLILSNARAVSEIVGFPPILLLDEITAHLDAGRRRTLHDEICAIGSQAWMTGTGDELFSDLGDRAQFFETREVDGMSVITSH